MQFTGNRSQAPQVVAPRTRKAENSAILWGRVKMKFMLVILITFGVLGEGANTIEMRIPQENRQECIKEAETFKFMLPGLSVDTRCELRLEGEEPQIRGANI